MCSKFIKLIVLLSLLVCCGFAGRVLYSRFVQSFSRTRERSTSHQVFEVITVGFSIDFPRCTGVTNNLEHCNASGSAKTKHR